MLNKRRNIILQFTIKFHKFTFSFLIFAICLLEFKSFQA
jgi:hypothetical protein